MKRETDNLYKLKRNISHLIRSSFKRQKFNKTNKSIELLGCTYEEFKAHIESQFESWMNWDNYGFYNGEFNFGWDLDHITPTSSALIEGDIIKLNHYTNYQPLCSHVNRDIKKDKLDFKLELQAN